jgi:hypothetical protein
VFGWPPRRRFIPADIERMRELRSKGTSDDSAGKCADTRAGKYLRIRLDFDHGQEGNQFSEIDSELSFLSLWRGRCVANRSVGTLRLESVLRGLEMPRTACTIWAVQAGAAVAVDVAGFNVSIAFCYG